MKIIENKRIYFIDGYLSALTDMDGNQGENVIRAFMKRSDDIKTQDFIKEKFVYMDEISLLQEVSYPNSIGLYYFLEKMVLLKPCNFCESAEDKQKIREQISNHRRYVISHLMDDIDSAFEDVGVEYTERGHLSISLLEHDKKRFIVLKIRRKNIEFFLVFFRKDLNHEEFIQWFDELNQYYESKTKEFRVREKEKNNINDNDICENGLTVKINREIIEPLIKKAIELGYFDKDSKNILSKYFSRKKIIEFEKILFNKSAEK